MHKHPLVVHLFRLFSLFCWLFEIILLLLYGIKSNSSNRMTFTENANKIFNQAIADYHIKDNIDTPINNPFEKGTIENRLYLKCWIDRAARLEAQNRQEQPGPY